VLEFGITVQEAIEAPRYRVISGRTVKMEVGGAHGITRHPATGVLMGSADPRRDGYALGF
jgi:gamma-glutamyltranspeptidase/glutathione hydrolase